MKPRSKKHGVRYPWKQWFREGKVILSRGRDFHCSLHGFAMTAREAAERHGIRVGVTIGETSVMLTVKPLKEKRCP